MTSQSCLLVSSRLDLSTDIREVSYEAPAAKRLDLIDGSVGCIHGLMQATCNIAIRERFFILTGVLPINALPPTRLSYLNTPLKVGSGESESMV